MMYDPQTSSTAPPHLWSGAKRGAKHTARIKPNEVYQKKKEQAWKPRRKPSGSGLLS